MDQIKTNIFLVDQDQKGPQINLLEELIDLRLIRQVKSKETVSSRPGKLYKAFLLDVSEYTGERARRDVTMVEFWKDAAKEKLRQAKMIYNPENQDVFVPRSKALTNLGLPLI